MKRHIKFLVFLLLLFCTCATTTMASLSKKEKDAIRTAVFKAPYIDVLIAVVKVFLDEGYLIQNADEQLGLITTEWKKQTTSDMNIRRKISATIKGVGDNKTTVRLKDLMQTWTERGWSSSENDKQIDIIEDFYEDFFDLIQDKLKE